ncbi:auxin transporter-like protein 1, partial [Musa troglodytarum]
MMPPGDSLLVGPHSRPCPAAASLRSSGREEDGSGREAFPSPEHLIEASSGASGVDSRRGGALQGWGHRRCRHQGPYCPPRPRQSPYAGIPPASLGFYPHERFFVCPNAITLMGKEDGIKGYWNGNLPQILQKKKEKKQVKFSQHEEERKEK